jgi:uncharacterized protein YodC (DUF2158 family)
MDHEFKAGDIVGLKSGGPNMTIEHIGKYATKDGAKCVWFDGKKRCEEIFELATLEPRPATQSSSIPIQRA